MTEHLQGTDEWRQDRLGKVTASRISEVIAKRKDGKPSAMRANYMAQLITERLTEVPTEHFVSAAMAWGTMKEPEARAAYAWDRDVDVVESGFVDHPGIAMTGCSPDGLVGDDGMVQFKCPESATHIDTLLTGRIDSEYLAQMQWEMASTNRAWSDFCSYDPRLPESMRLKIIRVERDEEFIVSTAKAVVAFLEELDAKLAALRSMYDPSATIQAAVAAGVNSIALTAPAASLVGVGP